MNSGKDLTGQIIEYLTGKDYQSYEKIRIEKELPVDYYLGHVKHGVTWEIRKFADKLKEIVCIMIGCKRSDLEDREFKETPLGEEWWYYILPRTNHDELLTLEEYSNLTDNQKGWCELVKPTPRLLLQLLGTDCGRKIIHPNVWVNALMSDYKPKDAPYNNLGNLFDDLKQGLANIPNWIITDVRFPNEVKAIKDRKGIVIRKLGEYTSTETHESETALDNTEVDHEIPYCEDIETLTNIVREILIKEKVL